MVRATRSSGIKPEINNLWGLGNLPKTSPAVKRAPLARHTVKIPQKERDRDMRHLRRAAKQREELDRNATGIALISMNRERGRKATAVREKRTSSGGSSSSSSRGSSSDGSRGASGRSATTGAGSIPLTSHAEESVLGKRASDGGDGDGSALGLQVEADGMLFSTGQDGDSSPGHTEDERAFGAGRESKRVKFDCPEAGTGDGDGGGGESEGRPNDGTAIGDADCEDTETVDIGRSSFNNAFIIHIEGHVLTDADADDAMASPREEENSNQGDGARGTLGNPGVLATAAVRQAPMLAPAEAPPGPLPCAGIKATVTAADRRGGDEATSTPVEATGSGAAAGGGDGGGGVHGSNSAWWAEPEGSVEDSSRGSRKRAVDYSDGIWSALGLLGVAGGMRAYTGHHGYGQDWGSSPGRVVEERAFGDCRANKRAKLDFLGAGGGGGGDVGGRAKGQANGTMNTSNTSNNTSNNTSGGKAVVGGSRQRRIATRKSGISPNINLWNLHNLPKTSAAARRAPAAKGDTGKLPQKGRTDDEADHDFTRPRQEYRSKQGDEARGTFGILGVLATVAVAEATMLASR